MSRRCSRWETQAVLTLAADLFNVTNTNTVVQRNRLIDSATFNAIQENISPRALRFGVRYSF